MSIHEPYSLMEAYYGVYADYFEEQVIDEANRGDEFVTASMYMSGEPETTNAKIRRRQLSNIANLSSSVINASSAEREDGRHDAHTSQRGVKKPKAESRPTGSGKYGAMQRRKSVDEELYLYDLVLDHLISEGYVDTEDAAIQIMAHMSEEWVDSIIDEATKTVMSVTSPKGEQRRLNTTRTLGPSRDVSMNYNDIHRNLYNTERSREGISFTPTAERNASKRNQEQVSRNRQGTINRRAKYIIRGIQSRYGIPDSALDPAERSRGIPNRSVDLR